MGEKRRIGLSGLHRDSARGVFVFDSVSGQVCKYTVSAVDTVLQAIFYTVSSGPKFGASSVKWRQN